uniref:Reverse transcriptase Ty1/copia-type domain-containing protein n=1 Tax=Solanum lycopersicum TaxID=4081 RepID=A0A3Q7JXP4_SOLLC
MYSSEIAEGTALFSGKSNSSVRTNYQGIIPLTRAEVEGVISTMIIVISQGNPNPSDIGNQFGGQSANFAGSSHMSKGSTDAFGAIPQFTEQQYKQILTMLDSEKSEADHVALTAGMIPHTTIISDDVKWIVDSGASSHMVSSVELLSHTTIGNGLGKVHLPTVQGELVVVLVYVDDLLVKGSSTDLILQTRNDLKLKFKIKDLGELKFFLGIEFVRSQKGIVMSQRKYALELISELGLSGTKPVNTPLETNLKLTSVDYDDFITKEAGLGFLMPSDSSGKFIAYRDSDWGGCLQTRRSFTGYLVKFGNAIVSWKSKKQETVARSSAEAEFRSMASVVAKITWLIASPLQLLPLDKENSKWLQLDKITRRRARECSKSNNFQRILTEVYVIDSLTERYERDMTKNFKSTATA